MLLLVDNQRYDTQRDRGHGYPDILTDHGNVYITETFKSGEPAMAKTHAVSPALVDMLYAQRTIATVAVGDLAATFKGGADGSTILLKPNDLPNFHAYPRDRYGFTVDMWISASNASRRSTSDSRSTGSNSTDFRFGDVRKVDATRGLFVSIATDGAEASISQFYANGTVVVVLADGNGTGASRTKWMSGSICSARLAQPGRHHLAVVADGGPKMVMFVVDGMLCDGGPHGVAYNPGADMRHNKHERDVKSDSKSSSPLGPGLSVGWGLFDQNMKQIGGETAEIGTAVSSGRLYSRALYVTECVGNWRAEMKL
jgi:hypothetical protein